MTNAQQPGYRDMNKMRFEAFSDGVFAFAITLLILGVALPVLGHPSGCFVERLDRTTVVLNLVLLAGTVMPQRLAPIAPLLSFAAYIGIVA